MVATDVASRGIGMIDRALAPPLSPPFDHMWLVGALLSAITYSVSMILL